MSPKRGAAKQEEEAQRKAEEVAAAMRAAKELLEMMAGKAVGSQVDPAISMLVLMQKQMQKTSRCRCKRI